jgi:hypothetical protein
MILSDLAINSGRLLRTRFSFRYQQVTVGGSNIENNMHTRCSYRISSLSQLE